MNEVVIHGQDANIDLCSRIMLGATDRQDVRYGATFLITSGTYSSIGLVNAWCTLVFYIYLLFN